MNQKTKKSRLARKGEGGRGPMFLLLIAVMLYALYSIIVGWQTLDRCENPGWRDWRLYPPGWVCN